MCILPGGGGIASRGRVEKSVGVRWGCDPERGAPVPAGAGTAGAATGCRHLLLGVLWVTGVPSSGVQLLPVLGFCQALPLREALGMLLVGSLQVCGAYWELTVPVMPTMLIPDFFTGASALGNDFICNLSFEKPLGLSPSLGPEVP